MRFGRKYENQKEQQGTVGGGAKGRPVEFPGEGGGRSLFGILFLGVYIWQEQHMPEELSAKVLRFHVLANSDSEADQALKLDVRDAVGVYMNGLLTDAATQEESVEITQEHLEDIQQVAGRSSPGRIRLPCDRRGGMDTVPG